MKTSVHTCNKCGTMSTDIYKEKGWISIDGGHELRFTVTNGRDLTGMARTLTYQNVETPADFCCGGCLLKFLGYKQVGEIS